MNTSQLTQETVAYMGVHEHGAKALWFEPLNKEQLTRDGWVQIDLITKGGENT